MGKIISDGQQHLIRLERTLSAGGLGLWRLRRIGDGEISLDTNDAFLTISGLTRSTLPSTAKEYFQKFLSPDEAAKALAALEKTFTTPYSSFSWVHPLPGEANCLRIFIYGPEACQDQIDLVGFGQIVPPGTPDDKTVKPQENNVLPEKPRAGAEIELIFDQVRKKVEEIIYNYGPGRENTTEQWPVHISGCQSGLAYYLNRAFSLITSHLDWYKAILDSLPFPIGVYDLNGRLTYLNKLEAELLGGGAPMDYLGQPLELDAKTYEDSDLTQKGPTVSFTRFFRQTNRLFTGHNSILLDDAGAHLGNIEVLHDITALREADERTQIMLDALPLACNFWNESFQNIDCNQAAAKLFDLPDKQAYLDRFFDLSPEVQPNGRLSAELAVEKITTAFREGDCRFEWMHQKLDGTPMPSEITLTRVKWRHNNIVVGYTRDLRELKATQAERDAERHLLRKIMDSTPICFFFAVEAKIKFITPFGHNFTGRNTGDLVPQIYNDPATWLEVKEEVDKNSTVNWKQVEVKRVDGQVRSMLLNAVTADYYGERGVMNWLMDVTELKDNAAALKVARDAAEESTRAKSEFLANMSHEIRTPLNAILGLIHLVMQTDLSEMQVDYLQKTESAAKTLLRIINDILDFSKIEAGKLEMEHEKFNLGDVMQQVVDLTSTKAHEKGLEFLVLVPPDTQACLVGDQIRLTQILSNLTSNAVKFTSQGQVTLKVETIIENDHEVTLRFLVEDTGIGMTEDQIKDLFSAFTQAESSTTRRFGGTGLGLVISKRLVEMMSGQIWCKSDFGHGSTFGFTAKFGTYAGGQRYVSNRKDFRGLSALAVDDNVVALEILSDFLQTLGFAVTTAASGEDAISILSDKKNRGEHLDLVFIDWKMPDMDGIETSKRIHELIPPPELPVIIMTTAYNRDDVLDQARQSGIHNVMTKPLSPSTMLNVLVDIFGRGLPEKGSKLKKAHEMAVVKEFAGSRVLLAEDNEVNQLVASRILKNAGLVVEIANNGLEAVAMVKANQYDLVLMDIQMPEMDGITATKEIRSLPEFKNLPIVAMTAHAMSGDRELSLKAGMNDHINKPINLQELFSTLAKWLRKRNNF